jgi:hypothetical protein
MRLTIGRWITVILACCAFVAALLLPLPRTATTNWFGQNPAVMSASVEALVAATSDRNDAIREYRVAQGIARWKANASTDAVQIDASTPGPVGDFMRTVAETEWRRAGSQASPRHAAVFVYFDTSAIAGNASPNGRRTAELQRPADVWFALPEVTDGERCVVLVRVRVPSVAQITHLRERSLLGPCAYFAAFGKPGPSVHRWLEATNYRAARYPDWDKPRAPAVDAAAVYSLGPKSSRCLTGKSGGCATALRTTGASGAPSRVIDGNSSGDGGRRRTVMLGDASPRFLADAVRELGSDRFAQFWTSSAAIESAFAGAANVSLDDWTARWLERSYGKQHGRPVIRLPDLLWLTVLLPLFVLISAGRRERVLTERLRLARVSST